MGNRARARRPCGRRLGRNGRARGALLPAAPVAGGGHYTLTIADELRISSRPSLERPILIAAFRGWNDGGQGASLATGYLAKLWGAERFADVDPEGFFDFQATRPHVSLVEGLTRRIDWPATVFYHGRPPGLGRDAVVLLGIEPNLRWRTFSDLVVGFTKELGVELVITLGALLADVPHTRPCPVTGSASDEQLVEQLGLSASRYEGPTGIVGVVHDACRAVELPSVSLWAAVPHYVSLTPSPRAALALCGRLGELLGTEIDTAELKEAADAYADQVSEAVAADPETAAYVEELEQRADTLAEEENLPSGEALAAELTRFLRDRERDNDGPDFASEQ
jgi:predicted ATP-grasp superfamily ATP-dependent carboligase